VADDVEGPNPCACLGCVLVLCLAALLVCGTYVLCRMILNT
jgi:hypothetical protein